MNARVKIDREKWHLPGFKKGNNDEVKPKKPNLLQEEEKWGNIVDKKFDALSYKANNSDTGNSSITNVVIQSVLAIGEKQPECETKLSKQTKGLVKKR